MSDTISEQRVKQIVSLARDAADSSDRCAGYVQAPKGFAKWPQAEQMLFIIELQQLGRIVTFVRRGDRTNEKQT